MKNIFKGTLRGYVCEDCIEAISGVEVLFYLPYRKETRPTNQVANTKDTFHYVSKRKQNKDKSYILAKPKQIPKGILNSKLTKDTWVLI